MSDKECPECSGLRPGDASSGSDVCTCKVCPSCGYPLPQRAAERCGYCMDPEVRKELGFKPLRVTMFRAVTMADQAQLTVRVHTTGSVELIELPAAAEAVINYAREAQLLHHWLESLPSGTYQALKDLLAAAD